MLEKGKFLEKTNCIIFFVIVFLSYNLFAETTKSEIIKYNNDLKNSSALFLQNDGENIEEGKIYFGVDRIKIDYTKPRITIILSEKKGIYTNHDLKESQFFNTKKSYIKVFFKIISGGDFSENLKTSENFVELNENIKIKDIFYTIKIIYEKNPLKLRKIMILENNQKLEMGFFNHINSEVFKKNFFSMTNPYSN